MEHFFGVAAMIAGVLAVTLGLAKQVHKNHKDDKCGISMALVLPATATCVLRGVYSFLAEAYWIVIPDLIGVVMSFVLTGQYLHYEKGWWKK